MIYEWAIGHRPQKIDGNMRSDKQKYRIFPLPNRQVRPCEVLTRMEDIIFILYADDIPAMLPFSRNLQNYRCFVFDPILLDKAIEGGLENCAFVDWKNCFEFPDMVKWSHSTAFDIEKKLDLSVREIAPEISILFWQHINLYYFLMAARWYSGLWAAVVPRFAQHRIHVCICDNPSHYFWPSYIPALLLLQNLKTLNIEFSAYAYGQRLDDTLAVPDLRQHATEPVFFEILSHLPTCFYDINYINDELKASGKNIINLQAKHKPWNVAVAAQRTIGLSTFDEMSDSLPEEMLKKAETIFDRVAAGLEEILTPYIASPDYRTRQVTHIASLYKSQVMTYYLLEEYFGHRKPGKVLLSDHDADFHGPIVAFAERYQIPVFMLPHSKVSPNITFGYRGITSLCHPIQGGDILDARGKATRCFRLCFPETFSASTAHPAPIRKIGLLLNGISLGGVCGTHYSAYMNGIRKIAQWCKQHDIELYVRSRPGEMISRLLVECVGLDRESLMDAMTCSLDVFAQREIDLCLMYDVPTSGAIEFLKRSVPILHPIPGVLAASLSFGASRDIVPRDTVEDTLATLDVFIADAEYFQQFRTRQFAAYVNLFREAHALRSFL